MNNYKYFFFSTWLRLLRLSGKECACNAGDTGDVSLIPGSGRSPAGGNGNPLWYSCLNNPMEGRAWSANSPKGHQELDMNEHSTHTRRSYSVQFSSVAQSCPTLCDPINRSTPASLSITNSWSSLRLTSIESVMPSSHLILWRPLLLLPPIPPSIRVFSNESTLGMRWPKYWSFSFRIIPSRKSEIPKEHFMQRWAR